ERMEERGEGSKEMLDRVTLFWTSQSTFAICVNKGRNRQVSFSTIVTVLRRLNGRIHKLSLAVDPYDPLLGNSLNKVCHFAKSRISIISSRFCNSAALPPLTIFNLKFFSRLIKSSKFIVVADLSISLTVNDFNDLIKVIRADKGNFSKLMLVVPLDFAKFVLACFAGVSPSYFDRIKPPFVPRRINRNTRLLHNLSTKWGLGVKKGDVETWIARSEEIGYFDVMIKKK
ncbi:hypothetical protein PFISCL1PPCAC_12220, partial [Pristionchus fissidentatus]